MTSQNKKPIDWLKIALKVVPIVIGWLRAKKLKKVSKEIEEMSLERLKICNTCPMAKINPLLEIINGKSEYVNTLICEGCHCPVLQKSLVKSERCPLDKWPI